MKVDDALDTASDAVITKCMENEAFGAAYAKVTKLYEKLDSMK